MTPSAASPIVPVTNTLSPTFAPARRTIVPAGTLPNIAIEIVTGPGVRSVSPPNNGQPNSTESARRPSAKPASQASSISLGIASDRRKPSGRAPFAARSDKFTRSALLATACAASVGKKWTPPTMASVLSTRSCPAGGVMNAASSDRPSAPGCVAIGPKKRAIRRSSAEMSLRATMTSSGRTAELGRAQTPGQMIKYRIDHAGLVGLDKCCSHVGIFRHNHARRHVAAMRELVGSRPERGAQNRVDALERPAFRQCLVDQRIKPALLAHDTGYHVAKEGRFGRQILCAFDLASDPVAFKLRKNLVKAAACKIHLVEGLHRRQTRRATLVGFAGFIVACRPGCHQRQTKVCLRAAIVSAARAAAPPLSPSSTCARALACASLSTVRIPFPRAILSLTARSMSARADSLATISKWRVSPRITHPSTITPS